MLLMKIYLRNLSPELEAAIRRPALNSDLDDFHGKWSTSDADSFEATLRSMRQVEPIDWNLTN
jgi:hypothetical protein